MSDKNVKKEIGVGVVGFGTVGTGVVKILLSNKGPRAELGGRKLVLRSVVDKDLKRNRGVKLPKGVLTKDLDLLLADDKIDIVVELAGGTGFAGSVIRRALEAGKHVVTANKALLAEKGAPLFKAAHKNKKEIGFEAACAGAIPIVASLKHAYVLDHVKGLWGILNGTSNYVLTKMSEDHLSFDQAVKEAQRLGFAEADPFLDVSGHDAAHKIAILSTIAFKRRVEYSKLYVEGIQRITAMDITFAERMGMCIKLLAVARDTKEGADVRVHPTLVSQSHPLASVRNELNAVFTKSENAGPALFYGKGAGELPTANAVVSDIVEIAQTLPEGPQVRYASLFVEKKAAKLVPISATRHRYYLRFTTVDRPGVLAGITKELGQRGISIDSMMQLPEHEKGKVPIVIMTHEALEKDIQTAIKAIDKKPFVKGKTMLIRVAHV